MSRFTSAAGLSALCLGFSACGGEPEPHARVLQELVLETPAPEAGEPDLLAPPTSSHHEILSKLKTAAESERVRGVFLQLGPMGAGYARAADLATALAGVREAGKPVHCHVRTTDNAGYALLAQACDRISMTPGGMIDLVGPRAQAIYARELLDRVGVRADILQAGRFKGAADALTEVDMPETTRTTLNAVLDAFVAQLAGALRDGRSIPQGKVQGVLDGGPYTANRARVAGLVDDVGFDDEARQHARKAAGVEDVERVGEPKKREPGLGDLLAALTSTPSPRPDTDYVRLVVLTGTIVSQSDPMEGEGASAEAFVPELRALADDPHCKAVLLRIDSPGGSALASDRMWHAVRRAAKAKPLFVSVGDMAASGGYYIASAADRIFAQDTSLVGSIGVVGGKLSLAGAADKLGVNIVQLTRGTHAGWTSPLTDLTESERAAMRRTIDATYRLFLRRVQQGRDMPAEQVMAMAEGRLMPASAGREGGLVDEPGGLAEALAALRTHAKLDDQVEVSVWPAPKSALARLFGGGVHAPHTLHRQLVDMVDPEARLAAVRTFLTGEAVATALPYLLDLR